MQPTSIYPVTGKEHWRTAASVGLGTAVTQL